MKYVGTPSPLSTLYAQLHPTRNEHIDIAILKPTHKTRVWWLCPQCAHEWESQIGSRWRGQHRTIKNCPECNNKNKTRYPQPGESLAEKEPVLALEWTKDNPVPADQLFPNSTLEGRWVCTDCSHEWMATPNYRTRRKACPQCLQQSRKIPSEIQQWTKTNLSNFTKRSKRQVEWVCPKCKFAWMQSVKSFVRDPCCRRKKLESPSNFRVPVPRSPKVFTVEQLKTLGREWSSKNENRSVFVVKYNNSKN